MAQILADEMPVLLEILVCYGMTEQQDYKYNFLGFFFFFFKGNMKVLLWVFVHALVELFSSVYLLPANSHVSLGQTWSWNLCIGEETYALEVPVQLPSAHVSVSAPRSLHL